MTTFVISDHHFGHSKIIQYCNRPFTSVEEMDEVMIFNHNNTVAPEDTVIFGGDFTFYRKKDFYKAKEIFHRLNGRKTLVIGNHDHTDTLSLPWDNICHYLEINHNSKKFVIFHYPILEWNGKYHGSIHIYGHIHDKSIQEKNTFNMCVENINYTPVNLNSYFLQNLDKI